MEKTRRSPGTLDTLWKGFEVIETVENLEGATLTEVADTMEIAVSTAHDYLTTLVKLGYLVKTNGEYQLGLKFTRLGTKAKATREITKRVTPYLERLADDTEETVWFLVEEQGLAVYLDHAAGNQAIKTAHSIGGQSHLHCHAGGKAILAHLSSDRVNEIIEAHGLPEITENTITSPTALRKELKQIRDQGYAQNDGEQMRETRSVSSAIVVDDEVHGAISIGGPAHRLRGELFEEELPNQVMSVANEIRLEQLYS